MTGMGLGMSLWLGSHPRKEDVVSSTHSVIAVDSCLSPILLPR